MAMMGSLLFVGNSRTAKVADGQLVKSVGGLA